MSYIEHLIYKFQHKAGISEQVTLPYTLVFDDTLRVNFTEIGTAVLLSGNIINISNKSDNVDLIGNLLRLNLSRIYEMQTILCLNQSSGTIELFHKINIDGMKDHIFSKIIENFVNDLEFWQNTAAILGEKNINIQNNHMTLLVP